MSVEISVLPNLLMAELVGQEIFVVINPRMLDIIFLDVRDMGLLTPNIPGFQVVSEVALNEVKFSKK